MPSFHAFVSLCFIVAVFGYACTLHWSLALTCPIAGALVVAVMFASDE